MEQQIKATILNLQQIVRKETGEVITKIGYMTSLEQTDKFVGFSTLDAWCNGVVFDRLKPFIGKEVTMNIAISSGKNNSLTARVKKINDIAL